MSSLAKYIQLTKPTIIVLVAVTGLATMAAEGSLFVSPLRMLLCLSAIIIAAGSANALNQFIDRDIDALMERTKTKRPLPQEQLTPLKALLFGLLLGAVSTVYLWIKFNPLAAMLSLGTILFYVLIYTVWLKRRHYYNIVIGGAAGATAPLIASAAAYGDISLIAWVGFLIIFTWTPPHFWALALALKSEYEKVKIPMLPNVLGEKRTITEIFIYTFLLLPLTLAPIYWKEAGLIYGIAAVLGWMWYTRETFVRLKVRDKKSFMKLFYVSILYLFILFLALGIDGAYRFFSGGVS